MIVVYDRQGEVVATVSGNTNLDFWDGHNMTCGSTGRHKGITRLRNGEYVLIHTTQWQGERSQAEIITPRQALNEILRSGNVGLLEEKRFRELSELYDKLPREMEDNQ